jgi:hypothetical protein
VVAERTRGALGVIELKDVVKVESANVFQSSPRLWVSDRHDYR